MNGGIPTLVLFGGILPCWLLGNKPTVLFFGVVIEVFYTLEEVPRGSVLA